MKKLVAAAALIMALLGSSAACPADAQGAANVRLVKRFIKEIDQAARSNDPHKEVRAVAERYMSADYIQHSRVIAPGREGYIQLLTQASPPPAPKNLAFFGEGEFVFWITQTNPPGESGRPKLNFNVVRVVDGKLQEHWDSH
jgi:predicted SnoaL-like aldol condensation-catalyzing enzyme